MPSQRHEALTLLFRESPDLGVLLARDIFDVPIPAGASAATVSAEFADLDPPEYRADAVLRIDGPDGKATDILIIEVQLQPDPDKAFTWHFYAAGARQRFRCPATIVVVTPDARVARWAAQPIAVDRAGSQFQALVLGPDDVPVVTEVETARALPELAVLSAVMHGHDQDAADIGAAALRACRELDAPLGPIYTDIIIDSLGEIARRTLEKLMDLGGYQFPQSDYFKNRDKKHYYNGQRDQLKRQLARKFGELPDELVARIDGAAPDELELWSEQFIDASSLDAVFAVES